MQVVSPWNAWLEGEELRSEVSAGHKTVLGTKPPGVQFTEKGKATAFSKQRSALHCYRQENSKTHQSCFLKKALESLMFDSLWVELVMSLSKPNTHGHRFHSRTEVCSMYSTSFNRALMLVIYSYSRSHLSLAAWAFMSLS